MSPTKSTPKAPALPPGVLASDLKFPKYSATNRYVGQFELLQTSTFGWCVATLDINAKRGRTYAARLADGALVSVGAGPHVLQRVSVYVTEKTKERLAPLVTKKTEGEAKAGAYRDRLSSRRIEGQQMRAAGRTSWRWTV